MNVAREQIGCSAGRRGISQDRRSRPQQAFESSPPSHFASLNRQFTYVEGVAWPAPAIAG